MSPGYLLPYFGPRTITHHVVLVLCCTIVVSGADDRDLLVY